MNACSRNRHARNGADQRLARRQRLGRDQRELALRLRLGQALHRLGAQFLDRAQEALAYFFGLQQRERRAQRLGIIGADRTDQRSEEHTSELQSLMRISYAVFCLKKKKKENTKYIEKS